MKTIYVAEDGKQFRDKEECRIHEANLFKDRIFLFNKQGKRLPLTRDGLTESDILICSDDKAASFLFDMFQNNFILPWNKKSNVTAGTWQWRTENDYWHKL